MKVLVYDAYGIKDGKYPNTSLNAILKKSDVITIRCPLTEKMRNLIDAKILDRMKRTALLINTARGSIVDEAALASVLNRGLIAGAGFDVLTEEPPKKGNPLIEARNIILTPPFRLVNN